MYQAFEALGSGLVCRDHPFRGPARGPAHGSAALQAVANLLKRRSNRADQAFNNINVRHRILFPYSTLNLENKVEKARNSD